MEALSTVYNRIMLVIYFSRYGLYVGIYQIYLNMNFLNIRNLHYEMCPAVLKQYCCMNKLGASLQISLEKIELYGIEIIGFIYYEFIMISSHSIFFLQVLVLHSNLFENTILIK